MGGGAKSIVEKVRGVCDSFKSQEAECRKKWREKGTVTKKKERIIESRHNKEKEARKETEKGKLAMTQDNASYEVKGKKRRLRKGDGEARRWQGGNA